MSSKSFLILQDHRCWMINTKINIDSGNLPKQLLLIFHDAFSIDVVSGKVKQRIYLVSLEELIHSLNSLL